MFGEKPIADAVFCLWSGNSKVTKVQEVQRDRLQGRMDLPVWRLRVITGHQAQAAQFTGTWGG